MADKQTGAGARGRGQKSPEGQRDAQINNPVSAKNQSKQKKPINRSSGGGDPLPGPRGRD